MSPDLIKALAELAWPVLSAIVLVALLPTLVRVIRSRAVSIKYGEMEISIQDVSDQLRKQVEDLQAEVQELSAKPPGAHARVSKAEVSAASESSALRLLLWVDDNPENNAHEIAKLQHDGWEVVTAKSTRAALDVLARDGEKPTLVISDMGRLEGILYRKTAGLDLIRAVRSRTPELPVVIYASADAEREYKREVHDLGGKGITASPLELFRMVEGATPPSGSAGSSLGSST